MLKILNQAIKRSKDFGNFALATIIISPLLEEFFMSCINKTKVDYQLAENSFKLLRDLNILRNSDITRLISLI